MDSVQSNRTLEALAFATSLEHIGDVVDQNLMYLASAKTKSATDFSNDGWSELQSLHRDLLTNFRLALDVFVTQDPALAAELIRKKKTFLNGVLDSRRQHLARLQAGVERTRATTTIHQDILRDFKQINSHLTTAAYPVLEQRKTRPAT